MNTISALFKSAVTLAVFLFTMGACAQERYAINVVVTGATPDTGQIIVNLFDTRKNYMRRPIAEVNVMVDSDGTASAALGLYPEGTFAVTVIYDQNSNNKLDTGFLGIPKEKIGYSNNARGFFGPAKWKQTRFDLAGTDAELSIQLHSAKAQKDGAADK